MNRWTKRVMDLERTRRTEEDHPENGAITYGEWQKIGLIQHSIDKNG